MCRSIAALAVILAAFLTLCAAGPAYAADDSVTQFLTVDKLRLAQGRGEGRDSFSVSGTFNMQVESTDNNLTARNVTLSIGDWSADFPAESWKRAGKSHRFTIRQGNVVGQVVYWVGNSSKCTFKFTGVKQSLSLGLWEGDEGEGDYEEIAGFEDEGEGEEEETYEVSVNLQVGDSFSSGMLLEMRRSGLTLNKLDVMDPMPCLILKSINITRNLKTANRDNMTFSGVVLLNEESFDSSVDSVTVDVGPFHFVVPAGSLTISGGRYFKYRGTPDGGGKAALSVDGKNGRFTIVASKLNLEGLTADTQVHMLFGNVVAEWQYGITMQVNKKQTLFRY